MSHKTVLKCRKYFLLATSQTYAKPNIRLLKNRHDPDSIKGEFLQKKVTYLAKYFIAELQDSLYLVKYHYNN